MGRADCNNCRRINYPIRTEVATSKNFRRLEKPTLKRVGLKQGRFGSRCKQSRYNSFFELRFRPRTKVFIYTFSSLLASTFLCNFVYLTPVSQLGKCQQPSPERVELVREIKQAVLVIPTIVNLVT